MIRRLLFTLFTLCTMIAVGQEKYYIWQNGTAYEFDVVKTDSIDFEAPAESVFTLGGIGFVVVEEGGVAQLDFQSVPAMLLQDVEWSSSDSEIASVANGVVFAKKQGMVTITAEAQGKKAERTVVVKSRISHLESISFTEQTLTFNQYEIAELKPVIVPSYLSLYDMDWSSSDKSVVEVINGVIVTRNSGKAIVSAKLGKQTASIEIIVNKNISNITADIKNLNLAVGSTYALSDLGVRLTTGGTMQAEYVSSDEEIVAIEGGMLVAKSAGTSVVTATIGDESIDIFVTAYISEYELVAEKDEVTLQMGDAIPLAQFGVSVNPSNAVFDPIEWEVSGIEGMISLDNFVAVMPGTVKLIASSGEKRVEIVVRIELKATDIIAEVPTIYAVEGDALGVSDLMLTVKPSATTDNIVLSSDNENIASVSNNKILAKSEGTCEITAICGDVQTTLTLVVRPTAKGLTILNPTLVMRDTDVEGVDVASLGIVITPDNAANKSLTWTSGDEAIVKVQVRDGRTYLVPVGDGNTTVVATLGNLLAKVDVTVDASLTSIEIDSDPLRIARGTSHPLSEINITIRPLNSHDKIDWESSDEEIFTIERGNIVAKKKGEAKLIARSGNVSAELGVTVFIAVEEVLLEVDEIELTLDAGGRAVSTLGLTVLPDDADDKEAVWESLNNNIAEVKDIFGIKTILPVAGGQTKVIVTVGGKSAELKVTVKAPVESVDIVADAIEIPKGELRDLSMYEVIILPEEANNRDIVWGVENTDIAEITKDGKVWAKKSGETLITATVDGVTDNARLIVLVPVTSITLNTTALTKTLGDPVFNVSTFEPTILPLDVTYNDIEWTSSDESVATIIPMFGSYVVKCVGGGVTTISAKAGDQVATVKLTVLVPVESVELSESEVVMNVGERKSLSSISVTINPSDASNKEIVWKSGNTDIAYIDSESGEIKAVSAGSTTLSAIVDGVSASIPLTVVVPATELVFSKDVYTITVDETLDVNSLVSLVPASATPVEIEWSIDDENIAKIEKDEISGMVIVKPQEQGEIKLTAKSGSLTASATVRIVVPLEQILFNKETLELKVGDVVGASELVVTYVPENATDKSLVWSSSDESIAKVEQLKPSGTFVITAVAGGKATITASQGDVSASIVVNVSVDAEDIVVPSEVVEIAVGKQMSADEMGIAVVPANTTDATITFASANTDIVRVVRLFGITNFIARNVGESEITATWGDIVKTFTIKVIKPLTEIAIETSEVSLGVGDKQNVSTLGISFTPEDATYKDLEWVSSDESIATIDDGEITAVSAGIATLTGTTKKGKSVKIIVRVTDKLHSIEISSTNVRMGVGTSLSLIDDLGMQFVPATALNTELTWTSSDEGVATVVEGNINALKEGNCILTGVNDEGVSIVLNVEVIIPVEKIEIKVNKIDMYLTQKFDVSLLDIKVYPEDATERNEISFSDTESKLSFANNTTVRAEIGGATTLVVECGGKKATAEVTIKDRITYASSDEYSFDMIIVDGGTYKMGEPSANGPEVTVSPFMIGETEMTQGMWISGDQGNTNVGENQPVSSFGEGNCKKAINALSDYCHKNETLPDESRFVIPTEAQWEWAARGGKLSKGTKFAGSNDVNETAWTANDAVTKGSNTIHPATTQPVKGKMPNELGIYDMCGNVSERVANSGDDMTSDANLDSKGNLLFGNVCRGGSVSTINDPLLWATQKVEQIEPQDCNVYFRKVYSGKIGTDVTEFNITRGVRLVISVLPFPEEITELK